MPPHAGSVQGADRDSIPLRPALTRSILAGVYVVTILLAVAMQNSLGSDPLFAIALIYTTVMGLALAVVDWATLTLPNILVGPSYLVIVALLVLHGAISGDWNSLVRAVVSAIAALIAFYLLHRFAGMGFGDVKLVGYQGLVLGWAGVEAAVLGPLAGVFIGGVAAVIILIVQRDRRAHFAYGPYLVAGALLVLVTVPR